MATPPAPGFSSHLVESSWPPPRAPLSLLWVNSTAASRNPIPARKIPRDLTDASLSGARLSIFAALAMLLLFGMGQGVSPVTYGHKRYSVMRIEGINYHSVLLPAKLQEWTVLGCQQELVTTVDGRAGPCQGQGAHVHRGTPGQRMGSRGGRAVRDGGRGAHVLLPGSCKVQPAVAVFPFNRSNYTAFILSFRFSCTQLQLHRSDYVRDGGLVD